MVVVVVDVVLLLFVLVLWSSLASILTARNSVRWCSVRKVAFLYALHKKLAIRTDVMIGKLIQIKFLLNSQEENKQTEKCKDFNLQGGEKRKYNLNVGS